MVVKDLNVQSMRVCPKNGHNSIGCLYSLVPQLPTSWQVATSPCATEAAPRRNRQRLQARLERAKDLQQREEQAETAPHAAVEHCSGSGGGWCGILDISILQA